MWDVKTESRVWTVTSERRLPLSATFSPDGRSILTGPFPFQVLNAANGQCLANLDTIQSRVSLTNCSLTVSPDSTKFLAAGGLEDPTMWATYAEDSKGRRSKQPPSGSKQQVVRKTELLGHSGPALAAAFSPDGMLVATGSSDSTAKLWKVETCKCWRTLHCHDSSVTSLAFAFTPRGLRLFTVSRSSVRIWDTSTGWRVQKLSTTSAIIDAAFDGTKVIMSSYGPQADECSVWDADTGECIQKLGQKRIVSVALPPRS